MFAIERKRKLLIMISAKGTLHPTTTKTLKVLTKALRKNNLQKLKKFLPNRGLVLKATMLSPKKEMLDLNLKAK